MSGGAPVRLRPVASDEIEAAVALMNAAYRGDLSGAAWTSEGDILAGTRTTPDLLAGELAAKPAGTMLVADGPGGALAGCAWLEPLGEGAWYLGSLTVPPAGQNAGVGRRLLAAAEAWAAIHGASTIRMSVIDGRDTLIAWYERRGYRLTGETAPFPYGDDRFGTPLRDDLRFVMLEKAL